MLQYIIMVYALSITLNIGFTFWIRMKVLTKLKPRPFIDKCLKRTSPNYYKDMVK